MFKEKLFDARKTCLIAKIRVLIYLFKNKRQIKDNQAQNYLNNRHPVIFLIGLFIIQFQELNFEQLHSSRNQNKIDLITQYKYICLSFGEINET